MSTYGLSVTGLNGSFQIDSNTEQTEFLHVIASGDLSGTASSRDSITAASAPDIVFMHKATTGHLNNGYNDVGVTAKYVLARKSTGVTSYTGTYGLEVWNDASTSQKIFDSRGMTEGINIIDVKPNGTIGGGRILSDGSVLQTSGGQSTVVYSGDPTGIYVSTIGSYFQNFSNQWYMQYYFDYTNGRINLLSSADFGYGAGWDYWPSWSMILIGKLQT